MQPTIIVANDLNELWFESIKACFNPDLAKKYKIESGSFVGQDRYQLYSYTGMIKHPETRPLAPIMPEGMSATTNDEYIEKYFAEYIMNPDLFGNNEYTYGYFIAPQLPKVIRLMRDTPDNNQAVISLGDPFAEYDHSPCLRTITFQYNEGKLSIAVFFRSWDCFAGLPTNLGGMQLLCEYVAMECDYETGPMFVYSSACHCYETAKPGVEQRLGKKFDW